MSIGVFLELFGRGCRRRYRRRMRRRRRRRRHLDCVSVQVLLLPPETNDCHAAATTTAVSDVCDATAATTTTSVCDAATASRRRSRGGEIKEARGDIRAPHERGGVCASELEIVRIVSHIGVITSTI